MNEYTDPGTTHDIQEAFEVTPVPITLFAKTRGCQQCVATKKHLDRQGTPYALRYVDEDPAAADAVQLLGYQAVPVLVAGDIHWSGYRPDKLNALGRLHTIAADIAELDAAAEAYLTETESRVA